MAVTTLAGGYCSSQTADYSKDPFILSFPRGIDTSNLWISYYATGAFGGYGGFVPARPGVWDYRIETTHEGKQLRMLKVSLYVPGYQAQTMDVSSQLNNSQRKIEIRLLPLATVPFSGRLLPLPNQSLKGLTVDVGYYPYWRCEFYGLDDCLLQPLKIASLALDESGRFKALLPDFAHDQTASSFQNHGRFIFTISKTNGILFLKPQNGKNGWLEIVVADQYPGETVFEAKSK